MIGNATMIQKVFFPRLLLPVSTVLSTLLDVGVSLVLVAVLMIATGVGAGPRPGPAAGVAGPDRAAGTGARVWPPAP